MQLLADAPQAFDPPFELGDRHLRLDQLRPQRLLQLLDEPFGRAPLAVDAGAQRFVGLGLEIPEGELFQLVLDLAHPQPVGNRRVDVARFLRDLAPPLVRQVVERPHIVEAVGEFHEDDANVVDHGEEHLADALGLALFARRKRNGADLGNTFHDMGDFGTEELADAVDRGQRVFDDVVEEPGGNRDGVELHVSEEVGDRERVDQIRLARMAHLSPVLERRKHVGPAQELDVRIGAVRPDLFDQVLEANHRKRCLNEY